jgi:hypothetical protein
MQSAFRGFFCEQFPEVRSVTTEASLNECLAGGAALKPWREVVARGGEFPNATDRHFWKKLRARCLR